MKPSLLRVLLCVVPVLIAGIIVGWAFHTNAFRLGVDLSGGTILIYEVDKSKTGGDNVSGEELAAALKRRIDPADLYNVTIRPVAGGNRVEIILPMRRQQEQTADKAAWDALIAKVLEEYPAGEASNPYAGVEIGNRIELEKKILELHPNADLAAIRSFVNRNYQVTTTERRSLSGEEIENVKNLISQQGKLEFRILANTTDDSEAIRRAEQWVNDPAHRKALEDAALLGDPPLPPRTEDDSPLFTVTTLGEPRNYSYSWVEVGKEELWRPLQLNNSAKSPLKALADKKRAEGKAFVPAAEGVGGYNFLLYSREIPNPDRLSPRDRKFGKRYEYFILTRNSEPGKEVTGQFLISAKRDVDQNGRWAVHFSFDATGAERFYELTSLNKPSQQGTMHRQLAIILDNQIRSAPNLNEAIRSSGQITGDFTDKEVDDLVRILRAGALPATLKPAPAAENTIGATLGADTIEKGTLAVIIAFFAVLLFMLIYYRFAGFVACVALLANLLLTVAFMVVVQATFTLPGLAGLVLMLGMAVDANVLIYERLREERERGASLQLALRNGYDRAFPTIIDTHLSSIFTAIVLYVVGNDQLKGFGISLTVGLIISLFTSLYMTRTIFNFFQANNWLKKLSMLRLFHKPNINFMAIRYYFFAATVLLTILGAAVFIARLPSGTGNEDEAAQRRNESSVLNIDFIGGTELTARLTEPMTIGQLRDALENSGLPDLSIEQGYTAQQTGGGADLATVRTAEKDLAKVQQIINDRLGSKLQKILMHPVMSADGRSADLVFTRPMTEREQAEQGAGFVSALSAQVAQTTAVGPAGRLLPVAGVVVTSRPTAFASPSLVERLIDENARKLGVPAFAQRALRKVGIENEGRYSRLRLEPPDPIESSKFQEILTATKNAFDSSPQPERLENFDAALAARTQEIALAAILASWAAILLYLWFRFGSWTFGAAAVLCLIHDLFFTLGGIAVCHYLYDTAFGRALGLGDFKIDLPAVAALLTLVGYSVNDTIVVFDRIREVRGKNPALTPTMINDSVNQTLSRTILSSLSVWLVVIVLYIWGGEGVHLFAFVMVIGVIVGTYSSIYIASPLLLIFGEGSPRHARERPRVQPATAEA
jgi:SecD/SecF fusion protein